MPFGPIPGNALDQLPGLILDSFELAMAAKDHAVAFRLLRTLERTVLRPEITLAQRVFFVSVLVDAHRRLLEQQVDWQPVHPLTQIANCVAETRH